MMRKVTGDQAGRGTGFGCHGAACRQEIGMSVAVEFHFDFGSPNAYLAHRVIPTIELRTGVPFRYVPVLLGGVFKATGNVSPAESMRGILNKPEYAELETARFLERHAIRDFRRNPHFPVNTLRIMRGAVYAQQAGIFPRYVNEVFRHMWAEPKKMDDPDVIRDALQASGLPADEILRGIEDPAVKQQLIANTEDSVARGTFGSPSFFVGGELYFGKDRLREVEEAIERRKLADA
jgi:2-hydroxychromene-2-carboxylate isomerase